MKRCLPLLALVVFLPGCATIRNTITNTITNLTPGQAHRQSTGLYPFAVDWQIAERSIQTNTIKAYVMVDLESYPMEKSPGPFNRWETTVPIPPGRQRVRYRYKFDYLYTTIPRAKSNSKLSPTYQLEILDR